MKSVLLLSLVLCLPLSARAQAEAPQAAPAHGVQRVTLYGPLARGHDSKRALFSFKTGTYGRGWDLNYGSLYVNGEHDWFQVSTVGDARTAMRDLGAHDWADSFEVPTVVPFPKLKPGEQRMVKVDVSGADGADGAGAGSGRRRGYTAEAPLPSVPETPARPQPDADGVVWEPLRPLPTTPERVAPARRPKQDGVPKVDPIFTRARVGHMYVLRVVDGAEDFYVLFRVESLVRGDNCTITWKRVPAPPDAAAGQR